MVQPGFLSQPVDQLKGFEQVTKLQILQRIFNSYGQIDETDLEENALKMMGPYNPKEPLAQLFKKLEKGSELACAGERQLPMR